VDAGTLAARTASANARSARIESYLHNRKATLEIVLAQALGRQAALSAQGDGDAVALLLAGTAETVLRRALSEVNGALAAGDAPSETLLGPGVMDRYKAAKP
jgi:hypothetical protein